MSAAKKRGNVTGRKKARKIPGTPREHGAGPPGRAFSPGRPRPAVIETSEQAAALYGQDSAAAAFMRDSEREGIRSGDPRALPWGAIETPPRPSASTLDRGLAALAGAADLAEHERELRELAAIAAVIRNAHLAAVRVAARGRPRGVTFDDVENTLRAGGVSFRGTDAVAAVHALEATGELERLEPGRWRLADRGGE